MRKSGLFGVSLLAMMAGLPAAAQTAPATSVPAPAAKDMSDGLQEVVVTARRREESAQTVPVSVSALSGDALEQHNVHEISDLNTVVPGFHFAAEGGKLNNNVSMRGLDKMPVGEGIAAVVTYVNEVPMPANGSNAPTWDLASVQVLKGPQGTLFGRNTIGGAVVMTPVAPNYNFGGYGKVEYGQYDYRTAEGAVNLPIIDGKVALRVGGQVRKQDGYTTNLGGGPKFDNTNSVSVRATLLVQPTDYIKSTFSFDEFRADEMPAALYLYKVTPNTLGPFSPILDPQLLAQRQQQIAGGFHSALSDPNAPEQSFRRNWGLSNITTVNLTDDITLKNIVGYRANYTQEHINTAASGPILVPGAFFGRASPTIPFALLYASAVKDQEYLTNETQLLGKSFNDKLSWIGGVFFNHDDAAGPMGSYFQQFVPAGKNATNYQTSLTEDTNVAVYSQEGLDLSDWVLNGLKFNIGARYSWDDVRACAGPVLGTKGYASNAQCEAAAALHNTTSGDGIVEAQGSKLSYTIGLDYQVTDTTFAYVTSRRGYRGVGVNTPLFQSPYTTGATLNVPGIGLYTFPDLRRMQTYAPETITDYEIGLKQDFKNDVFKGRFDIAAFTSEYKNAIQFFNFANLIPVGVVVPDSSGSVGANVANETIRGIEVSATAIPAAIKGLTLTFNGAYTDSHVDSLTQVPIPGITAFTKANITLPSPRMSGSASMRYVLPVYPLDGSVVFSADYYRTGKFGAQFGVDLPGYGVANARIDWIDIAGTGADLGFAVTNFTDEHYFTGPSVLLPNFAVSSVFTGAPRMWLMDVKYSF